MNLREKIELGLGVFKSRFLNKRTPLFVAWAITNKCNLNCIYCLGNHTNESKEISTQEALNIIDQLKSLGTKSISFTGGEALLRKDIVSVIDYAKNNKIRVNLNTNGVILADNIDKLGSLSSVRLSLDGQEHVNDFIRGPGVYKNAIRGLESAIKREKKVCIITVLTRHNLNSLEYLIKLATDFRVGIAFQPATERLLKSAADNPHAPDPLEYKNAIDRLIMYKRKYPCIVNTIKGLLYIRNWPEGKKIRCFNKNISCRIEPDGLLCYCGRSQEGAINCLKRGVKEAFLSLSDKCCPGCWCAARLETNFVSSFDLGAIFSAARNYGKIG